FGVAGGGEVRAGVNDAAADLGRGRQQAEDRGGGDRFAGAAFADQGQSLPGLDVEGDAAHRLDHGFVHAEVDAEVLDRQQRTHVSVFRGSNASRTASPMNTSEASMTESVM